MFKQSCRQIASVLSVAVASGYAAFASAQVAANDTTAPASRDKLDEIVVTAQKREENIQKIPVAVTAISGESLEQRGIIDVTSFAQVTSGLTLNPGTSGVIEPFLRGVGTTATNLGQGSSVAVYEDGVYFTRLPVGFFSLNDVERVEVLKGPQGTLFGRNSSAGVIQIITKDPSQTTEVKGSFTYSNYDTVEGTTYATTGLTDKVAVDFAAYIREQYDGYGNNIPTGNPTNYSDNLTLRSKLLAEPSDDARITLAGFYTHTKVSQQGNTYPGTIAGYAEPPYQALPPVGFYDQRNAVDSYVRSHSWGVSVKEEQNLHFAQLTSITAYTEEFEPLVDDGDYTNRDDFLFTAYGYVKQFTQEVQLSSAKGSDLKWIAGLFYYNALNRYVEAQLTSPDGDLAAVYGPGLNAYGLTRANSIAGYAQTTYEILPRLSLTGGLRYTYDDTKANGSVDLNLTPPVTIINPGPANLLTRKPTFKTALDYQFTDSVLGYVSVSDGFKSGTFNLITYDPVAVRPEVLYAYEVGIKSDLFDRRVRIDGAAFQYNIKDPQVQLQSATSVVDSNAGSSRVRGAEIEIEAAVTTGLNARFSATYLDSIYLQYGTLDAQGDVINGAPSGPQNPNPPYGAISPLKSIIADGNYTPLAPKLTFDTGLDYSFNTSIGGFFLSTDYYLNDGFYWEPDNFLRQKSYGLLSARIRYQPTDHYGITAWGKNLTGAEYATTAVTQAGPAGYPYIPGPPRTYGLTFDFRF